VHQLGVFYDELREFFNASSLDDRLRHLESGTAGQSAVENAGRLLRLKQGGKPPWDQLAALTDLRDQLSAILAASRGAAGGEAAAALPAEVLQKVRLADIELDSYAFTLLAAVAKDVEGRGLSSAQGWRFALSALGYGMRNMHASQILGPETLAAATELAALASQGSVDLLRVKAAVDRARRATEDFSAAITDAHVRRVLSLSAALGVDRRSAAVFAEAVVRSTVAFQSSRIADAATRCARDALGIPPWDPLFNGSARGKVVFADALGDVRQSPECVIAVCRTADGDEDVPKNVRGVVLGHAIPHLSHLGVRARQSGVVFVCAESRPAFDAVWSGTARSFQSDAQLLVTPAAGFASLAEVASAHGPSRSTPAPHAAVGGKANGALIDIGKIDASETGVLPLTRATAANSSAKCTFAGRLAAIAGEPQALFAVPGGVCIPFGVYKAAERPHRAAVGELMAEYDAVVAGDEQAAAGVAQRLREFIDGNFAVSDKVVAAVQGALPGDAVRVMVRSSANCEDLEGMSGAGLYDSIANVPVSDAPQLAAAVRRVWASLWTRRAASSRGAYSVAHSSACMATLVQRMVEAEVSFVAFSHNPVDSSDCGHVYIELAVGMGETLASGGVAGQPYRLRVSRQQPGEVTVDALASYGCALVPLSPGARVKSASGLRRRVVDYSTQRMTTDAALRAGIASRIARVILKLEAELGGAQDVEGAVTGLGDARSAEGVSLFVVQARPQVSNSL
jgi:phosphoglucan, water dikinase